MSKKRVLWLYIFLLGMILHAWAPSVAYSIPGEISLWSPPANLFPGSLFTVPITLDVGPTRALGSLTLELRYDPTVIVVNSIASRVGEFDSTLSVNSGSFASGATRLSLLNKSSLLSPTGAIHAVDVEFKVVGNLGSLSPIDLSVINFSDTNALPIPIQAVTPTRVSVFKTLHVASSDYDGDGKPDLAVWRPGNGTWYIQGSSKGLITRQWGISGDIPVPGDYDGDKRTDLAVWRPADGHWYILASSRGIHIQPWGMAGDIPVVGDYDGDQRADFAVWRPAEATWYILGSISGLKVKAWGLPGDIPVPKDYDGDGLTDLGVWRSSEGKWYILASSSGLSIQRLGSSRDTPAPGDYDGNGLANLAVWNPDTGTWRALIPGTPQSLSKNWGISGDIPVPTDVDHDNKTDLVVWRPGDGVWYALTSSSHFVLPLTIPWGANGDIPVSGEQ